MESGWFIFVFLQRYSYACHKKKVKFQLNNSTIFFKSRKFIKNKFNNGNTRLNHQNCNRFKGCVSFRKITNRISKRSEEHTSELQSRPHLVCRLLLEKKKNK